MLFVFSWTAVVHWVAIAAGFTMLVARGPSDAFIGSNVCEPARIASAGLAAIVVYAVLQFLITLVTLAGVGAEYIDQLKARTGDS